MPCMAGPAKARATPSSAAIRNSSDRVVVPRQASIASTTAHEHSSSKAARAIQRRSMRSAVQPTTRVSSSSGRNWITPI